MIIPEQAPEDIAICFAESEITDLFAALIEARGGKASVVSGIAEATKFTKIITEPRYFPEIPPTLRHRCLVVGNPDSLNGTKAITLSRPLTEAKVERAIAELLDAAI